jgi:uncharacterized protein (DUF885 family)
MNDHDGDWRALADRYWDRLVELEPILGTEVGDERYDHRLPDPSEAGRARRAEVHGEVLVVLRAIDRTSLDMLGRTTVDLMETVARRDLRSLEHRTDRFQAVSHLWGPGTLLADIGSLQQADTPERRERYLARLRAVPAFLDAVIEVAREGEDTGETAPDVVVDRAIAQVDRLLALDPEDSPALRPLAGAPPEERAGFVHVIREALTPAYARYAEALRDHRTRVRDTIGVCDMPDGDAKYAAEILSWTTLPLDADRIHQVGRETLAAIQEERREIARALGHAEAAAALDEYQASGRNVASSREEMVRLAVEQVERGWDAAPRYFGRMPRANCEVRKVEEYREADMPFAFYQGPTEDGSRPGVYYVNTSDLPERPLHHLASTTYHEANPGHHFQVSIEQEMDGRPAIRRFGGLLAGSAFIEGWALYCERLADEMGLFLSQYERLGMLDAQAFRAARLVVDTGIHAFRWDRDRAIREMIEAGVPSLDATIEVDRYIAMPGQALSYMIGQLEIQRWRRDAEHAEGASFSVKDFHDRLLGLGSVPLTTLSRELDVADPT